MNRRQSLILDRCGDGRVRLRNVLVGYRKPHLMRSRAMWFCSSVKRPTDLFAGVIGSGATMKAAYMDWLHSAALERVH